MHPKPTEFAHPRRALVAIAATLALAAALVLIVAGREPALAGGDLETSCANADLPSRQVSESELRQAVRCMINEQRAIRGLDALASNASLQKASKRHTKAMIAEGCLAHRCGDEPNLEDRLRRAGYFKGARSWQYAESTGCGLSAQAMVSNWMKTKYHRINILREEFKDVGVGVTQKRIKDRCKQGYATFSVVFAWRELKKPQG